MTATTPAVLFRVPDELSKHMPKSCRGFELLDVPEDTQAALKAWEVLAELDREVGSLLRARHCSADKHDRAFFLAEADRIAAVAAQLADALRDLNARWSGEDQAPA